MYFLGIDHSCYGVLGDCFSDLVIVSKFTRSVLGGIIIIEGNISFARGIGFFGGFYFSFFCCKGGIRHFINIKSKTFQRNKRALARVFKLFLNLDGNRSASLFVDICEVDVLIYPDSVVVNKIVRTTGIMGGM